MCFLTHKKNIWQNPMSIHDKNSQIRTRTVSLRASTTSLQLIYLWWKAESFSSKIKHKARMSTVITAILHSTTSCSTAIRQGGKNRRSIEWKRRNKCPYSQMTWSSTYKFLELISEFSKVWGYKINTKKSVTFLHKMNLWKPKFKTMPFIISTKKIKYLDINLPKYVQDLCAENYWWKKSKKT